MKVKWGSIITAGSGTLGGHVYSRNHYGAFARTKVNPFNPETTSQQDVRNIFQSIQTSWRTLTMSQRAAWSAASIDYPKTNSFGSVYYLTGYNLFISLNIPFYFNSGTIMTDPPSKNIPTSSCAGTLTMNMAAMGLKVTYDTPPDEADVQIKCYSTRPLSAGVTYVSTELRFIGEGSADARTAIDMFAFWTSKFATLPLSGQQVFVRLVPVNVVTGDYGIPYTFSAIEP